MAQATILNVGSELTTGYRLNTHAEFLGAELLRLGHTVRRIILVPDEPAEIIRAFETALKDSDLIFVTGGLGPTEDDVTLNALSIALGRTLKHHTPTLAKIKRALAGRGIAYLERHGLQARVFANAVVWMNPVGFAPGQTLAESGGKRRKIQIVILPGPPNELKAIWQSKAAAHLRKAFPHTCRVAETRCLILSRPESWVAEQIKDFNWLDPVCEIGVYSDLYGTRLVLREKIEGAAKRKWPPRTQHILARLSGEPLILAPQTIPSLIRKRLLANKESLATAESCTGGLLGRMLVAEPGISDVYKGGVIAYADEMKTRILNLSQTLLKKHGAVSETTARAMAESILRRANADYGIAVTGIAGPSGGTASKPVGLVYFGIARRGGPTCVLRKIFSGRREMIQEKAAHFIIAAFYRLIAGYPVSPS